MRGDADRPAVYLAARQTTKTAEAPEDCQDAWWHDASASRVAVADGVTRSFFSREWAWRLVRAFCEEPDARILLHSIDDQGALTRWLAPLQSAWVDDVRERADAAGSGGYLVRNRLEQRDSAGATLVGLEWTRHSKHVSWIAAIVGDSCLFHFTADGGRVSLPITSPEDFDSHPEALLSAVGQPQPRPRIEKGNAASGDLLVLATDALAKFLLAMDPATCRETVLKLATTQSANAFDEWVVRARNQEANKRLEDDDATLVAISIGEQLPGFEAIEVAAVPEPPFAPVLGSADRKGITHVKKAALTEDKRPTNSDGHPTTSVARRSAPVVPAIGGPPTKSDRSTADPAEKADPYSKTPKVKERRSDRAQMDDDDEGDDPHKGGRIDVKVAILITLLGLSVIGNLVQLADRSWMANATGETPREAWSSLTVGDDSPVFRRRGNALTAQPNRSGEVRFTAWTEATGNLEAEKDSVRVASDAPAHSEALATAPVIGFLVSGSIFRKLKEIIVDSTTWYELEVRGQPKRGARPTSTPKRR
jgi:hypothetical protein